MTSRLLPDEQVQAIVGEHIEEPCPFGCRSHETYCKACEGVWPCPTKRLADHIAAQAEQIERLEVALEEWAPADARELLQAAERSVATLENGRQA